MSIKPLYLNFRGYLPVSKVTRLYLGLDAGVVFNFEYDGAMAGFYLHPALGANFKVSQKTAINVSLGWKSYVSFGAYGGLALRLGVQF